MNHLTDSQLNEYLDRRLSRRAQLEAEAHLTACDACRVRLEELQWVFSSLAGLPEVRMPRDLTASVINRLPQRPSRLWTPLFAAQLGAALGVLGWLTLQGVRQLVLPFPARLPNPILALPDPQTLWAQFIILLAGLQSPSLPSLPAFEVHLPAIPDFHSLLPNISALNLTALSISISLLWLIGNATLLGSRNESRP